MPVEYSARHQRTTGASNQIGAFTMLSAFLRKGIVIVVKCFLAGCKMSQRDAGANSVHMLCLFQAHVPTMITVARMFSLPAQHFILLISVHALIESCFPRRNQRITKRNATICRSPHFKMCLCKGLFLKLQTSGDEMTFLFLGCLPLVAGDVLCLLLENPFNRYDHQICRVLRPF